MEGTNSKQADLIYKGIIEYYTNISGLEITSEEVVRRDKFIADGVLLCETALDEEVLKIQDSFIAADGNISAQKEIIENLLSIL